MYFSFKGIIAGLFALLYCSVSLAQSEVLKQVDVQANKESRLLMGRSHYQSDSVQVFHFQNQSVGDLLMSVSPWQVRSYGVGMLSTAQSRGAHAEQVRILWKGRPINTPTVGLIDLNLIPSFLFDDISTIQGSGSGVYGNGSIGGVLHLSNAARREGWHLGASDGMGSFGFYQNAIKSSFQSKKIKWSLGASDMRSKNDFEVINLLNQIENQVNARAQVQNIITDFEWNMHPHHSVELYYWYQRAVREIPPTRVQSRRIVSSQFDEMHRLGGSYSWDMQEWGLLKIGAMYLNENQAYIQNIPSINDSNRAESIISDLTWQKLWKKQKYLISMDWGLQSISQSAKSPGLGTERVQQQMLSLFNMTSIMHQKYGEHLMNIRRERMDSISAPLLFTLSGDIPLAKKYVLKYSVSNHFRFPTINHRFWQPGGNINLKPEQGEQAELGLVYRFIKSSKWKAESHVQAAYSFTRDYILWSPGANGLWSPENLKAVQSRIIEYTQSVEYSIKPGISLQWRGLYVYNYSVNAESYNSDESIIGRQLIYQARHALKNQLYFFYKKWDIGLYSLYNGSMPTNHRDIESTRIPAFGLWDIKARIPLYIKKYTLSLLLEINNITQTEYEMVLDRPMPGRNYRVGVRWGI